MAVSSLVFGPIPLKTLVGLGLRINLCFFGFSYVRRLLGATASVRSERQKQRGSGTSACRLVKEGRQMDGRCCRYTIAARGRGRRASQPSCAQCRGGGAVYSIAQQAVPDAATSQRCDVTSAVAALTVYSCRAAPPALGPIQRAVQCCVHRAQTLRCDKQSNKTVDEAV